MPDDAPCPFTSINHNAIESWLTAAQGILMQSIQERSVGSQPDGLVMLASQDVLHHALDIPTSAESLAACPLHKNGAHVRASIPVIIQAVKGFAHWLVQGIECLWPASGPMLNFKATVLRRLHAELQE